MREDVISLFCSSLPPGLVVKGLLPEHAEVAAKHWYFKDWFAATLPFEQKVKYLRELILRLAGVGIFVEGQDEPVSWTFMKAGMSDSEASN